VLARADRPFLRNGLPMLVGMALAFAVVATLASVAGGWVVSANQYGRTAALTLLAIFGLTLLFPELADRLMRPLSARHRHRLSVGALRRTCAGINSDRRSPARR
jgi:cytochrome c biogenesis protein CcdA